MFADSVLPHCLCKSFSSIGSKLIGTSSMQPALFLFFSFYGHMYCIWKLPQGRGDPLTHCVGCGLNPPFCLDLNCCSHILNPLCHSRNSSFFLFISIFNVHNESFFFFLLGPHLWHMEIPELESYTWSPRHRHSNARSEPHWPMPQLVETQDP